MTLANEDRGGLVGAFIVEEGDEILSITQAGQVVRSPINADFRPTGRSTMGVKFVTPEGRRRGRRRGPLGRGQGGRGGPRTARRTDDATEADDAAETVANRRMRTRMQQSTETADGRRDRGRESRTDDGSPG